MVMNLGIFHSYGSSSPSNRGEEQVLLYLPSFSVLVSGLHTVGASVIETALQTCEHFLSVLDHCDIDVSVDTPPSALAQHWAEFLHDYYMVAQ